MHTGQHHDDELSTIFVTELGIPRPERELGIHGGTNTEQTARMLAALGPLVADGAPRRRARLRRHELDAGRRAGRGPGARAGRPRRGRACAPSIARCPRSSTACSPTTSPTCCCARRRRRSPTSSASTSPGAIELVGDVMVDVALLFQPRARADDGPLREAGVSAGRVRAGHRAPRGQRRRPARACARWSTCCSRCRCAVVLPLHPRTRARLEDAGLARRARGRRARPPAAAAGLRRLHGAARRAPARCSPTRAACRRRPTSPACRA